MVISAVPLLCAGNECLHECVSLCHLSVCDLYASQHATPCFQVNAPFREHSMSCTLFQSCKTNLARMALECHKVHLLSSCAQTCMRARYKAV